MIVGYALRSTDAAGLRSLDSEQALTAQRQQLLALGADPDRIYVDQGLTRTNRSPPGQRETLAAAHAGDTLSVTKLDRLARSVSGAESSGSIAWPNVYLKAVVGSIQRAHVLR